MQTDGRADAKFSARGVQKGIPAQDSVWYGYLSWPMDLDAEQ